MKYLYFVGAGISIGIIALIIRSNVPIGTSVISCDPSISAVESELPYAAVQENIFDISDQMTKDDAIKFAEEYLMQIFGIYEDGVQAEADYYENSSIQPNGWFVQVYDNNWDYAVWIEPDDGRVKFSRGSSSHSMMKISTEEMQTIVKDNTWTDNAKQIISKNLNDTRKVVDVYFDEQDGITEYSSVDITLVLEDGHLYTVSFYSDGILRSLLYF